MRKLSDVGTVCALLNGMIGSIVLLLPILAIRAGYLLIPILSLIFGFASFYTAWISIRHLENRESMDQVVREHFNQKPIFSSIYNVVMGVSMTAFLILYYDFLCQQIQGLLGLYAPGNHFGYLMKGLLPAGVALFLLLLVVIIRNFDIGAKLLSLGIISIIGYLIFLLWVYISSPSKYHDENRNQDIEYYLQAGDSRFFGMAAHLGMGYAIHNFMIPILKRNDNIKSYSKYILICYILGILIYTFIAYSAYGIIHRANPPDKYESIKQYFRNKDVNALKAIQILYSIHLISVFPQFLLIAKSRIFGIFNQKKNIKDENNENKQMQQIRQQSQKQINVNEDQVKISTHQSNNISKNQYLFFVVFMICVFVLKAGGFKIIELMQANGAVICFLYVYLIPIVLHFKCVYFTNRTDKFRQQHQQNNQENKSNLQQCEAHCRIFYQSKYHKWAETLLLFFILLVGVLTMIYTLVKIVDSNDDDYDQQ